MSTLLRAHNQWSNRPADETFESVEALHATCSAYRQTAAQATVSLDALRVEANDGDLQLVGRTGNPAHLTHWSFGQLCARAAAPAAYLRELPATLAAQNLNHGLARAAKETVNGDDEARSAKLLLHRNGGFLLRAITSDKYSRIWNSDITSRLAELRERQPNWHLPMAYVREPGTTGFSGLTGEMAPRGAYASDHDMFCFLVDDSKRIEVPGTSEGLNRGFFVWNSEVGAAAFGICFFLYDRVCGNSIVWGAQQVAELRIRHVGDASPRAFQGLSVELRKYAESSTSDLEAKIESARNLILGASKDDVLDTILGRRIPELTRKRLSEGYDLAERAERYGSPRSAWGIVNGLTELSQKTPYADARVALDRAAGKLLETIAF